MIEHREVPVVTFDAESVRMLRLTLGGEEVYGIIITGGEHDGDQFTTSTEQAEGILYQFVDAGYNVHGRYRGSIIDIDKEIRS